MTNESSWAKLEDTICNSKLFTSSISNFNDPFESNPILVGDNNNLLDINFKTSANTAWSMLTVPLLKDLTGQKIKGNDAVDLFRKSMMMVSFSRRINSGLLWGHYANGYRGIALHFVPTNDPNSPFNQSAFHWVNYEKQRPYISFEQLRFYLDTTLPHPGGAFTPSALGAFELQFMSALMAWKSDDWAYEQEARLITKSDVPAISFPPSELVAVILGPLCSEADEAKLRHLIKQAPQETRIVKARLSRTDYSIEIDW